MFLDSHIQAIKEDVPDFYYEPDELEKIFYSVYHRFYNNNYSKGNMEYYYTLFDTSRGTAQGEHGSIPGSHNIYREILEITNTQSILEIGFNCGTSSLGWLMNGVKFIHAIDNITCLGAQEFITNRFPNRFKFTQINSKELEFNMIGQPVDMVFIDGEHSTDGVFNDVVRAFWFSPRYLLFDDTHSTAVLNGIEIFKNKLTFIANYGILPRMSLYKINPQRVRLDKYGIDV